MGFVVRWVGCWSVVKQAVRVQPFVPLLSYQREAVESAARFNWYCWSRQTGKSFSTSLRRLLRGLARGRTQIFLSAGERQGRELMLTARRHCQAMQVASRLLDSDFFDGTGVRRLELVLPRGVRVIGLPANPDTARGFSGDVLLDEFAMHRDDRAIWASMFPTLLRGGGELDVASTPKGCGNLFAELRGNSRFCHRTVTLPDAVAAGLDVDIAAIREAMGDEELYRQEFLCEFLDEATAFLTYEQIAGCEDPGLTVASDAGGLSADRAPLCAGVDIGRRRDLTVIWIVAVEGGALVTRCVIEMRGAPFRDQYAVIREVLAIPRVRRMCIDSGGLGMQLAESAVEDYGAWRVEALTFTAASKTRLAVGLRRAVEDRRIRIPVDPAIRNDWHTVRRAVGAGGQLRFEADRSGGDHADRFWAAAMAVRAADGVDVDVGRAFRLVGPPRYLRRGVW